VDLAIWSRVAVRFFGELGTFLQRVRPHEVRPSAADEERLCRMCYVLGLYDELVRSPAAWVGTPLRSLPPAAEADDVLALCPSVAVDDLAKLARGFLDSQTALVVGEAVLNPTLGSLGGLGADGDLVVDGCYIDIKAATDPKRIGPKEWPWQLLGYALLDQRDSLRMRSAGLYLARQTPLLTWSLEELILLLTAPDTAPTPLASARSQFAAWLS
jgi:hypothetical protein